MSFTFLDFDFRRATVRRRDGVLMCGFVPLVGKAALTSMARVIRQWKLGRRTSLSFQELAAIVNPIVRGWMNYCVSRKGTRSDWRTVGLMM